jgi:hypothetical protein
MIGFRSKRVEDLAHVRKKRGDRRVRTRHLAGNLGRERRLRLELAPLPLPRPDESLRQPGPLKSEAALRPKKTSCTNVLAISTHERVVAIADPDTVEWYPGPR